MKAKYLFVAALVVAISAFGFFYCDTDAVGAMISSNTASSLPFLALAGVTRLEELRNSLEQIAKDMRALLDKADADKRDLTTEESAQFDALQAKRESTEKAISRQESLDKFEATLHNPLARKAKPSDPDVRNSGMPSYARHGKLKSFVKNVVLSDGRTIRPEEAAYRAGMWLRAAIYNDANAKLWCVDHGLPLVWDAMGEKTNTAGGFLVPDEFETTIIDLREEYGVFRSEVQMHPMSSDHVTIPRRTGGLTAYAIGENTEITASDKSWDNVSLTARKWGVLSRYSTELSEDAVISLADDLASEIAYAFAVAEDNAGFVGDGTSTYHGIRGLFKKIIDGTHTAGAVDAASGHDTFAEIDANDLSVLMGKLPKYALRNAKWYCSQPAFSNVFERLAQAAGGNTKSDMADGTQLRYQGYPVVISQSCPTSTADLSDVGMLAFGDLRSACTMGTRRGITVRVSEHRYFELDQLAIRGTERFDINHHDLGDNTTAGPVVVLVGE